MPRKFIPYDFHRFSADGVQKRFFANGRTTPWSRLASAQTVFIATHKRWQTVLIFRDGLRVRMTAGRVPFTSTGQERYAEILALACAKAPPEASIDEPTRDIATWGSREVRRMTKQGATTLADADTLYARAANQRAWLEHKKALKTVTETLLRDPRHAQAHALHIAVLSETGAKPAVVYAAASRWAESCPHDTEAKLTSLRAGVLAQDTQAIERAAATLVQPPLDPALAFILADEYFREKRYALATVLLDRLADTTADDAVRGAAVVRRDYINRYAANAGFRRTEGAKTIWRYLLAWLPLVVMIGFYGWRAYEAWRPRVPEPDPWFEQQRAEMVRQEERFNRRYQELTGEIIAGDEELKRRADAGEVAAQYTLASDLLKQTDQELRVREGMALLEMAAAQNYRWALLDLGEYLLAGEIIEKDAARALACFEKAAELGSPRAAVMAGDIYREGKEVAADPVKALALFEQAALGGNSYGATQAGWAYEKGEGVPIDVEKALGFYRQAAEKDNLWALERITDLLLGPTGPLRNEEEGLRWMRRGAEEGSDKLRFLLFRGLVQGLSPAPGDIQKAVQWAKELAEAKTEDAIYAPYAAYDLGYYYWSGMNDAFDLRAGLSYFEQAAQKDMPGAIFMVARCQIFGIGTERDLAAARALRDRLAELAKTNKNATEKMIQMLDQDLAVAETEIPTDAKSLAVIHRSRPSYPMNLRRAGVEGEALIDFEIGVDGFVSRVDIIRATHPEFGAAALLAVSAWRFVPKREDGQFVPTHSQVPIVFSLNNVPSEGSLEEEP